MLRLVENDSINAMLDYCKGDPFGCRILTAYRTYGLGESFAQFWLQYDEKGRITAAVGSLDNALTVCAHAEYDCEEIDTFVRMLAGANGALRQVRNGEIANGVVMCLDRTLTPPPSGGDIELNPPCEELYSVLENCPGLGFEVPPFEAFYSDTRRRIKAGTVMTSLLRVGVMPISCAAVHYVGDTAVLIMCATLPEHRGKGCGAACTVALIGRLPAETKLYTMCLPGYISYYEKIGFRVIGGFVY